MKITWETRHKRIDTEAELHFLAECEADGHTHISAKKRFLQFLRAMRVMKTMPKNVLDVGGNRGTGRYFSATLPASTVTILNASSKELYGYKPFLKGDASDFRTKGKSDLIILGELLEHVYNPDGVIASSVRALVPGGYVFITTPNLACIYNRVFLALGLSLMNYFPSLRYRAGNRFLEDTDGVFGIVPDHKSVFTYGALKEVIGHYGLSIVYADGYDYGQKEPFRTVGERYYTIPASGFRSRLNDLLPIGLREGLTLLCRKTGECAADEGILKRSVWDL